MDQSSLVDSILDHRNDLSDANSVDSYVLLKRIKSFINHRSFSFSAFSIDSGVVTTTEGFENDFSSTTTEKLYNELQRVKEDLKSKDNEIRRANEIRKNTDQEIEDLTASLFEVKKK